MLSGMGQGLCFPSLRPALGGSAVFVLSLILQILKWQPLISQRLGWILLTPGRTKTKTQSRDHPTHRQGTKAANNSHLVV